jgi:hypothetical protein
MTVRSRLNRTDPAAVLSHGTLGLAGVAVLGTAADLAAERHWQTPVQLVAWAALVMLAVSQLLLAFRPDRRAARRAAQVLCVVVLVASVLGVVEHVAANLDAGVLDGRYSARWAELPVTWRLWYAVTKTVGPAPPLAPGALGQAALLTLLSAWRGSPIGSGITA